MPDEEKPPITPSGDRYDPWTSVGKGPGGRKTTGGDFDDVMWRAREKKVVPDPAPEDPPAAETTTPPAGKE